MTEARRLREKPLSSREVTGASQCEQLVVDMSPGAAGWTKEDGTNWRRDYYKNKHRGRDPGRCFLGQAVEINGRKLCTRHGGAYALALLLGEAT